MNLKYHRLSAAALTLVFCLAITPGTVASPAKDRHRDPVNPIAGIVKKIKTFFGQITALDDFPTPPYPKP
jgi:hypothetical protein